MYSPPAFTVDDLPALHAFMQAHNFATLVTVDPANGTPFATHLPVLLEAERGSLGTIVAHMARANPQWQHFTPDGEVLLIFQGPHAYVSPTWYKSDFGVPTWNYMAVHVYGKVQLVQETSSLMAMLDKLVAQHEDRRPQPYTPQWADKRTVNLVRAIVGFELTITRVEGKYKLSQNRTKDDQLGAIAGLQGEAYPDALALAQLMETQIQ